MTQPDPQYNGTRMGQFMIAIGFVIGIILLTLFFDDWQQDQINPNQEPLSLINRQGVVEVSLDRNRQGHYVMTGAINNVPADFILDTGATDVVIPAALAREAGLEPGYRSQAMTASGIIDVYSTTIRELNLAGITLYDVRASINPLMSDNIVLLGMSALRQVEFSQQGSRLTLRHHP